MPAASEGIRQRLKDLATRLSGSHEGSDRRPNAATHPASSLRWLGVLTTIAGIASLVLWAAGRVEIIDAGAAPMRPWLAMGFIAAGLSLTLLESGAAWARALSRALAWLVAIIGLVACGLWAFSLRSWFEPSDPAGQWERQVASPAKAVAFTLLGLSLLLTHHPKRGSRVAQMFAVAVGVAGVIAATVQIKDFQTAPTPRFFPISDPLVIAASVVLAIGILIANRRRSSIGSFLAKLFAAAETRRTLPIAVAAVIAVASMDALAEGLQVFGPVASIGIVTVFTIVAVVALIRITARAMKDTEARTLEIRQSAQLSILEGRLQLDAIVKTAMDAIIITSGSGRIINFNSAAEKMFKMAAADAYGRSIRELLPSTDLKSPPISRGYEGFTPGQPILAAGLRRDGREFPVETAISHTSVEGEDYLTLILRDITDRIENEERLATLNDRLRNLALRLQTIGEQERTTLAREIHDVVGQALTVMKIDVVRARRKLSECTSDRHEDIVKQLSSVVNQIDESITTVQRISTQLRPALLDQFGLSAAIEWEAEQFTKRTHIPCRATLPEDSPEPTPDQATALFRILQECLTNIIRHADATAVEIALHRTPTEIHLKVSDNGRGTPPEHLDNVKSLGLLGMRERAMALGGTTELKSPPEGGTVVSVSIPIRPAEDPTSPAP